MVQKEHLTLEGLAKIVALKASMNMGLSEELKAAFSQGDLVPISRPSVVDPEIKDPNWLVGFVDGEGCFFINIINSPRHRLGIQVQLVFQLTQHSRDVALMESLINYLDCGNISKKRETFVFIVTKFSDIENKIIPFFQKYPLLGVKRSDYLDFCRVAELMQNKAHLTKEGLDQIRQIKTGMNKGRLDENSVEG